jgi:hypothetical protein
MLVNFLLLVTAPLVLFTAFANLHLSLSPLQQICVAAIAVDQLRWVV